VFGAAAGCAWSQLHEQHHAKHLDADTYAKVLDDPSRDAWQKPHEVVMALALKSDEVVADIGTGTGYFAKRFAHHAGTVYAVDIEPKLLEIVRKNAPKNLQTVLGSAGDPKLPAGGVDTVFICNVWHHIEDRAGYLGKLKAALKPGGRIVVIEFYKRELPVGPPPEMKIEESALVKEFADAGMKVARGRDFLPYQYFLEFRAR
jgi:ubiquinone/menaquinone biosynthesis C-methylase UbiE